MNNIFHNPELQRIDVLDSRFYTIDNKTFYPGVTYVLEAWPKGFGFEQWLKDVGQNADEIKRRAAEKGSKIHDAIDRYLKGNEITWMDGQTGETLYQFDEWIQILKFVEFYETIKPEIIANEFSLVSSVYELGGTVDILCRINGELWIIDIKSSNYIHDSYELQLAAYSMMFNEVNKEHDNLKIDRCGILWLNAQTRGEHKNGKKIQGKGWQLKEWDRHYSDAFKTFQHLQAIWKEQHPNYKPKTQVYPDRISIKNNVTGR